MARRLLAGVCALAFTGIAHPAWAQGAMLWFEGGGQTSTYGSGVDKGGPAFGGGVSFVIGGSADQSSGVIVPVGVELKYSSGLDMVSTLDLGIRIRSFSFGPGASLSMFTRSDLDDPRCLIGPLPDKTSCAPLGSDARGKRDVGGWVALAPSFFAKATFGPQGRAFAQGRYIYYAPGFTSFKSLTELIDSFNFFAAVIGSEARAIQYEEPFHPVDYPEFDHGQDVRLSAGYVFGGGVNAFGERSSAKVIRLQYSTKKFEFTNVLANANGLFDQSLNQVTVGFGWVF